MIKVKREILMAAIQAERAKGKSYAQIAREFGLHQTTVFRNASPEALQKAADLRRRQYDQMLNDPEKLEEYKVRRKAAYLGIPNPIVKKAPKEKPVNRKKVVDEATIMLIRKWISEGIWQKFIAKRLGISRRTVNYLASDERIEKHKQQDKERRAKK